MRALASAAAEADGTAPLNEEAHFALDDDSAEHYLHHTDGRLDGYLQWQPRPRTAQLVVDPGRRRRGIGSGLYSELAKHARPAVWAFGDLPAARGFAAAHGLAAARTLLKLARGLAGTRQPSVPDGVTLRGYTPADADAVLAVNAAAFAHHPEQGGLDTDGLARRMAEEWFDPDGLILAFDAEGLAGFHWTKVAAGVGEVYVVGVHPSRQGRGYGKLLLDAGLAHLAAQGLPSVVLYVDAGEPIAVRMYEHAGFAEVHRDVLYAQTSQE